MTENIQSIAGFVILPRAGLIHWPTHPYIMPCFAGQNVKGISWDAAQFSFGFLTTDLGLPSWQSWGFWYISACVYLLLECGNRKRQILSLEEKLLSLMKLSVIHLKGYWAHVFTKYLFATVAALKLRKGALCCHLSVNWEGASCTNFGPIYLPAFFLRCISIDFLKESTKTWRIREIKYNIVIVLYWRKSEWCLNITCFGDTTTEPQSCMG